MQTIKRGSKGETVKKMQQLLMAVGYGLPKYGADGSFGAESEEALRRFQ
ncbi:peptidoglycan-binding protein, partial [[Clostridium] scindens]